MPTNGADEVAVERVVRSYMEVGQALEARTPIPFTETVRQEAVALTRLMNRDVDAIRFETADEDALVAAPPDEVHVIPKVPRRVSAYGSVTGRIQTLTSRGSLRFTIYDRLFDRPVSCYLVEGSEDTMRDAWGQLATVEGWVSRDSVSGRPLSVRRVSAVKTIAHEGEPEGYRAARGAAPREPGDPRAEERIRRLRDAG